MAILNTYSVSTFRTLGPGATTLNLFAIVNGVGSGVVVGLRRMGLTMDTTTTLTSLALQVRTSRITTLPTTGTILTKVPFDTEKAASAAGVVCRGSTASDGGAATAITATPTTPFYEQLGQRMHTNAGQVLTDIVPVIPVYCETEPFVLNPGEALLVTLNNTVNIPNTNHFILNCVWDESV
jgi:hypothetical protein